MSALSEPRSREEIQKAFNQLLRTHEAEASKIATKAQEAEQLKDREIVERAAGYTVESIINSLAKLQLSFGSAVDEIAAQLGGESGKLDEVRRSIEVEKKRLDQLRNIIVAAEALAILEQDHAQKLAAFEENAEESRAELRDEIAAEREEWEQEKKEAEAAAKEYEESQAKERKQTEEDHKYDAERQDKVTNDENADRRRQLERELADQEAAREKEWAAREKVLDDDADKIEELRTKVAGFADKLSEAKQKARDKAIAAVNRDAKFEAEMLEKEQASNLQVYELRVQTLEERIQTAGRADRRPGRQTGRDHRQVAEPGRAGLP